MNNKNATYTVNINETIFLCAYDNVVGGMSFLSCLMHEMPMWMGYTTP